MRTVTTRSAAPPAPVPTIVGSASVPAEAAGASGSAGGNQGRFVRSGSARSTSSKTSSRTRRGRRGGKARRCQTVTGSSDESDQETKGNAGDAAGGDQSPSFEATAEEFAGAPGAPAENHEEGAAGGQKAAGLGALSAGTSLMEDVLSGDVHLNVMNKHTGRYEERLLEEVSYSVNARNNLISMSYMLMTAGFDLTMAKDKTTLWLSKPMDTYLEDADVAKRVVAGAVLEGVDDDLADIELELPGQAPVQPAGSKESSPLPTTPAKRRKRLEPRSKDKKQANRQHSSSEDEADSGSGNP
ncbi:hypothetical protein BBJ28_00025415, partial [Nothophytophthora sp. Chile5]